MKINNNVIGLFGTCGNSTWRESFIKTYEARDIEYFNPQVPDGTWHPGMVAEENRHLMEDSIILFPITAETTGYGSLAEIGFSIMAAIRRSPDRYFIILIDDECTDSSATLAQIKESNRTRALVKSKVEEIARTNSGVYLVKTLVEMHRLSIQLYNIIEEFKYIDTMYKVN